MTEFRKKRRYTLISPTTYRWVSDDGQFMANKGTTWDISTSGVFVVAQTLPPVGARIELELLLPTPENKGPGMRLYGEGHVLRVERENHNKTGFAASVQFTPETRDDEKVQDLQTHCVQ